MTNTEKYKQTHEPHGLPTQCKKELTMKQLKTFVRKW